MTISDNIVKYVAIGLIVVLVVGAGLAWWKNRAYAQQIASLQNQVAQRDVTVEVQKDLYSKLAQNMTNVQGALDTRDAQVKELADQVKQDQAQLVQVTNLIIQLQKQVAKGTGKVSTTAPEIPTGETQVSFDQKFGLYRTYGYTLSPSGKYEVHLDQTDPLKMSVAMARDSTGAWHAYATSNDPGTKVDIGLTGIDESAFVPKWYEKLRVHADVGAGSGGVLFGTGASYPIGKFDIGPSVWATPQGTGAQTFVGATVGWRPFAKGP
jgi:hypothetical protein